MQCFVTGATGCVGDGIVEALKLGGHDVVGLSSRREGVGKLESLGVRGVLGDLRAPEMWRHIAGRAEVIIHAGQVTPRGRVTERKARRLADADRVATGALLDSVSESCRAFVYTSGCFVYGPCGNEPATESAPTRPWSMVEYKVEGEQAVLDAHRTRGVPAMVLRPGAVYGLAGPFRVFSLNPTVSGGPARYPGDGSQLVSYIHVSDLGQAFRGCIERPVPGEIFNVVDDEPVSVRTMHSILAQQFSAKPPQPLPRVVVRLFLGLLADPLLNSTTANNHKLKERLGWKPRFSTVREGISEIARTLREAS